MKKFTIQIIILLIIIFLSLAIATSRIQTTIPFTPFTPQREVTTKVKIGGREISVELADTKEKRAKGLGGRENLASNSGMLFIFPKEDKYQFWMKEVKFPLDLIWIRKTEVVDIIKDAKPPEPGQKDETLPIYLPREPVDMVLEVTGGFVDMHNIKIGDTIEIMRL